MGGVTAATVLLFLVGSVTGLRFGTIGTIRRPVTTTRPAGCVLDDGTVHAVWEQWDQNECTTCTCRPTAHQTLGRPDCDTDQAERNRCRVPRCIRGQGAIEVDWSCCPVCPTRAPTESAAPSSRPTRAPTEAPVTPAPTTTAPTAAPTAAPTGPPTARPSDAPSQGPTSAPTLLPCLEGQNVVQNPGAEFRSNDDWDGLGTRRSNGPPSWSFILQGHTIPRQLTQYIYVPAGAVSMSVSAQMWNSRGWNGSYYGGLSVMSLELYGASGGRVYMSSQSFSPSVAAIGQQSNVRQRWAERGLTGYLLPAGVHGLRIELKMMSTATAGWGDNIAKFDNISITFDCETQAPSPNTPTDVPTAADNSDNSVSEAQEDNSSSSTGTTVAITLVVLLILVAAVFFVIQQRRQVVRKQSSGPSNGSGIELRAVGEDSIVVSPTSALEAVADSAPEGEGMLATKVLPSYSIANYGVYDNGGGGGNVGADYRVPDDNIPVVEYAAAAGPSPSTAGQHGKLDGSPAQDGKITKVYGSVHGSHRPINYREVSANFC